MAEKEPTVRRNLLSLGRDQVAISAVTVGELYYGAFKSNAPEKECVKVNQFINGILILPVSRHVLYKFADIKADLSRKGQLLEDFDLVIAATALNEERVLLTHNAVHYQRVVGLLRQDWMAG